MEKLSLDKFSDKELENMKVIQGGEMLDTTWTMSDDSSCGSDCYNTETDEVGCYVTLSDDTIFDC